MPLVTKKAKVAKKGKSTKTMLKISCQPSLRAVMDLIRDLGKRILRQEQRLLTSEKTTERQEKHSTLPPRPPLSSGQYRLGPTRQDHHLPQPRTHLTSGLYRWAPPRHYQESQLHHPVPRKAQGKSIFYQEGKRLSKNGEGGG